MYCPSVGHNTFWVTPPALDPQPQNHQCPATPLPLLLSCLQVGHHLPEKLPLFFVLLVAFCLGVLVTYAEPAIAAIRPLAALVDPVAAPYLYYILNQQQELTVSGRDTVRHTGWVFCSGPGLAKAY